MTADDITRAARSLDSHKYWVGDIKSLLGHIAALEAALHKKEEHPGYEYACTNGPRKAWDITPPAGGGWGRNVHAWGYEGGFCRRDHHEEQYWMREVKP